MNPEVTNYLSNLDHSLKPVVEALRKLIISSVPNLTEGIKWNAPSYALNGADRLTFNLHRPTEVQLVFHRGAKPNPEFKFEDSTGLLKMASPDRGILSIKSDSELVDLEPQLVELIRAWVTAS